MIYNSPKREIIIGFRAELKVPDDIGTVIQLIASKPEIKIVESYHVAQIPKDRDEMIGLLNSYGKIVYQEDVVAYVDGGKNLEDSLINYLVELRSEFIAKKNILQAEKITEKLRLMGVVLMPRKNSAIIWNAGK